MRDNYGLSYKDGVLGLKDIINTESKFANRKRPAGWITPTARQCVQTHINVIKLIRKILPVTDWTLEYNKFAFMELEHGRVCVHGAGAWSYLWL